MANTLNIVRETLNKQLQSLESLLATTDYDYEDARASYESQLMYVEEQLQVLDQHGLKALEAFRKLAQKMEKEFGEA